MKEEVSVNKALIRGQFLLVVAPLIAMSLVCGVVIYLMVQKILDGPIPILFMLVAAISAGWLVWSFNVVKWKIWAFENVKNVHELARKAIEQKLIWPDGSWCNKTEIWSYEQRQKWKQVEKKFKADDEYHDDLSVPKETILYFSKLEIYLGFIIGPLLAFIPLYVFDGTKNYILLAVPFLGIYFIYRGFKKFINRNKPQFIIDGEGIYIEKLKEKFLWKKISDLHVSIDKSGSYVNFLYTDDKPIPQNAFHPGEDDIEDTYLLKHINTEINEFNLSAGKIENLLQVYEARYRKNNPN